MAGPLKAKVIMARCSKNKKSFGIRIEQRGTDWVRTWAFPINERKAKHEGFDANTVTGSLGPDNEYPGCPYCGSTGFVQCGCKKNSCAGGIGSYGDTMVITCPWCGKEGELENADSFDVSGGGY